jgi:hypothetical protein
MRVAIVLTAVLALAACSEAPQEIGSAGAGQAPAFQGTGTAYQAPGWKPGDDKAWEAQIKQRNKGQDEYQRIGS